MISPEKINPNRREIIANITVSVIVTEREPPLQAIMTKTSTVSSTT